MAVNKLFATLFVVCCLGAASHGATDGELSHRYRFSKVMANYTLETDGYDQYYKLYWSFNKQNGTISFAVRASSAGWVGFGLSPNGQMPNSDVVIGWVDNNGVAHFHVRVFIGLKVHIFISFYLCRIVILWAAADPLWTVVRTGC